MINVYYLETQYRYRGHDLMIQELVLFLKKYYNANIIHQKGGHLELPQFDYRLPDCEILFHDTENDILKGVSFSDLSSGIEHIFTRRNKVGDLLLISHLFNFLSPTFNFNQFNCKIKKCLFMPTSIYLNHDTFYVRRKLNTNYIDKLYFRGNVTGMGRFSVLDLQKTDYFCGGEEIYDEVKYFDELIQHKVGLALPGIAELCYRDVEYMAVGVPILKIKYMTDLNPDLIPNFHYISIDRTNELDGDIAKERLGGPNYADAYIKRFLEVKDDNNFLDFISKNAREYYENYLHPTKRIKHLTNLLGLTPPIF